MEILILSKMLRVPIHVMQSAKEAGRWTLCSSTCLALPIMQAEVTFPRSHILRMASSCFVGLLHLPCSTALQCLERREGILFWFQHDWTGS